MKTADLIFAMEASHLVRLLREYPEAEGRAFLLSSVTNQENHSPGNPDAVRGNYATSTNNAFGKSLAATVMSEIVKGSH